MIISRFGGRLFDMRMVLLGMLTVAGAGLAQDGPPAFEVASIKAAATRGLDKIHATPGSLLMENVSLRGAMAWAYHVFDYQVSGPSWMQTERYDIAAKAAGPATEAELRAMLQTLLADRFKLAFHRETKEMSVYVLSVGKGGPKFHESKTEGESNIEPQINKMAVLVQRVPVSRLVNLLSQLFQVPVLDTTGLTGQYDVTINIAKYLPQQGDSFDPLSVIRAGLQEELGLKLEPKKAPVDLLVVDSVEKVPVEN